MENAWLGLGHTPVTKPFFAPVAWARHATLPRR